MLTSTPVIISRLNVTLGRKHDRLRLEQTSCYSVLSRVDSSQLAVTVGANGDQPGGGKLEGVVQAESSPDEDLGVDVSGVACVEVVCPYTRKLVAEGFARRLDTWRVTSNCSKATLHWADYELVDWTRVLSGELRASSYCVRKGLSRKAQLSRYCNKYVAKRPGTPLKAALPRTLVIDTWEAFDDDMAFNLGGDIASFGADLGVRQSVSLATRLDWCLDEAQRWIEDGDDVGTAGVDDAWDCRKRNGGRGDSDKASPGEEGVGRQERSAGGEETGNTKQPEERRRGRVQRPRRPWILKPSTLNKGAELFLGEDFQTLREAVHGSPDIREWVLQEYVDRPLLVEGRKFHLRAYVLADRHVVPKFQWHIVAEPDDLLQLLVPKVYFYDDVLLLRAAKRYPASASVAGEDGEEERFGDEPLAHITNSARQAEDGCFMEEDNVWLLEDLVGRLEQQGLSAERSRSKVDVILTDMKILTVELFRAFRGEFTVFSPLPGCFEHFGLDFLVDDDFHVWLLEANPGPDFKQTGLRLQHVISGVIEGTMRICLDDPRALDGGGEGSCKTEDSGLGQHGWDTKFKLVLDERWRGGSAAPSMKMT